MWTETEIREKLVDALKLQSQARLIIRTKYRVFEDCVGTVAIVEIIPPDKKGEIYIYWRSVNDPEDREFHCPVSYFQKDVLELETLYKAKKDREQIVGSLEQLAQQAGTFTLKVRETFKVWLCFQYPGINPVDILMDGCLYHPDRKDIQVRWHLITDSTPQENFFPLSYLGIPVNELRGYLTDEKAKWQVNVDRQLEESSK